MYSRNLKWINTAAFLSMICVNAAANLIPIGGNTTGQVSEQYPNLFTPAPFTFAIWGVIYAFMAGFIVYQWEIAGEKTKARELRERIGIWFAVSCALNVGWIFSWHFNRIGLSVVLIAALMVSLAVICQQLSYANSTRKSSILANTGFDVYFGWILAAVIANVSVWLTKIGWDGFGLPDSFWTIIVLFTGAGIVSTAVIRDRRWFSGAAVIWAFAGIIARHLSQTGYASEYSDVLIVAFAAVTVILCSIVFGLYRSMYWRKAGAAV